jgi:hypothetical protein
VLKLLDLKEILCRIVDRDEYKGLVVNTYISFLLKRKWTKNLWAVLVVLLNLLSLFFMEDWRAQLVLSCFFLCEISRILLFVKFGESRLLALSHVYWIPMLWVLTRNTYLVELSAEMATWLSLLIVINSLCLLLDMRELWRYFKEQKESVA